MSQTIVPTAPAGAPDTLSGPGGAQPASGSLTARLGSAWRGLEHALSGTPGRLRVVSALSVLAAVLIALGGGAALRERSAALDDAKSSAAHLVLVQSVQIRLAQADADATNSFLGFGTIEPQGPRLEYIGAIQQASIDIAKAAQGSFADAARLGPANAALTRYTGYVSSARAYNLDGLQVGANYLSTASALLQDQVLKPLAVTAADDQKDINSAYSRANHSAWWLALVAVLGLGVLVWSQFFLARHSRRILNLPLAAATLAVLIALIVAGSAMVVATSKANDVKNGPLTRAQDLSASRVAAFSAKSSESLTLIKRGSATTGDGDWLALEKTARSKLSSGDTAAAQALDAYATEHKAINNLDVGVGVDSDWPKAVKRAIRSDNRSANALFQTYAGLTEQSLATQAAKTTSDLSTAGDALLPAGILIVLLGLLAAAGAWWGVTLRLDEYR